MALTTGWNLRQIISEIRSITGRPDESMMSDETIVNYINQYYQYVLTKELKIFYDYTYYSFYTQSGIDHYNAPEGFQTVNPGATADGWPIEFYIDPDTFYQDYPNQQTTKSTVAVTDGTNNYNFTLPSFPITTGSLYITDGTNVMQSNPDGSFYNPVTGNIQGFAQVNFTTGQVTNFGFAAGNASDIPIIATYQTYNPNRPTGILYYHGAQKNRVGTFSTSVNDDWFVVRPVPDQCYQIKMQGMQVPPALGGLNSGFGIVYTDKPFRTDLGPLIALATSLTIFRNANQTDQYNQILQEYERYKNVSMQDTYELYLYQRSVPTF